MGERIFFSKLRKVLASWLLCIKFENARLVIFQIGYGPSHLISMLAVSLSPLSPSFCWQEHSAIAVAVCAHMCAGGVVGRDLQEPPLLLFLPSFHSVLHFQWSTPSCPRSRRELGVTLDVTACDMSLGK